MTLELIRNVLGWCALINYGILLLWFLIFSLAHDWLWLLGAGPAKGGFLGARLAVDQVRAQGSR